MMEIYFPLNFVKLLLWLWNALVIFICKMNYLPLITNTKYHLKVYTYSREGWLYGSWIYNYLCNQCLSPLLLWVRTLFRQGVLNTLYYYTLYYIQNKSDVFTKLVPQGNITVVHRSTNVMFHVCPEMYPFLHSGITILTGS
jgi:hypothetical protein